jgi:hypothetical protein
VTPDSAPTQTLVFGFDQEDASFEGRLVGALERAESGGALRVLRALFVGRDATSGELAAIDLTGTAGGLTAQLLEFRLDPERRRKLTERALEGGEEVLTELGSLVRPGAAIVAVLVEHSWAEVLADAVARTGGHLLADELVPAGATRDFGAAVLEVARRAAGR